MSILRRATALLAIVALVAPLMGAGGGTCVSVGPHEGMGADSQLAMAGMAQTADMVNSGGERCDACDDEQPDAPPPCQHGDAVVCASMTSCAALSAMIYQPTGTALDVRAAVDRLDADREPRGERASPEPPPPRA